MPLAEVTYGKSVVETNTVLKRVAAIRLPEGAKLDRELLSSQIEV